MKNFFNENWHELSHQFRSCSYANAMNFAANIGASFLQEDIEYDFTVAVMGFMDI